MTSIALTDPTGLNTPGTAPSQDSPSQSAPPPKPRPKSKPSPRKLAANRANAQKSTGPKSPKGKQRSSKNAQTHGLCSNPPFPIEANQTQNRITDLLPDADPQAPSPNEPPLPQSQIENLNSQIPSPPHSLCEFHTTLGPEFQDPTHSTILHDWEKELSPTTVAQRALFQQIVAADARLRRLHDVERHLYSQLAQSPDEPPCVTLARSLAQDRAASPFLLLQRYYTSNANALKSLLNAYRQEKKTPIRAESQSTTDLELEAYRKREEANRLFELRTAEENRLKDEAEARDRFEAARAKAARKYAFLNLASNNVLSPLTAPLRNKPTQPTEYELLRRVMDAQKLRPTPTPPPQATPRQPSPQQPAAS